MTYSPTLATNLDWAADALCAEFIDDGTWFDDHDANVQYARTVCDRCPVKADCLEVAMTAEGDTGAGIRYGVFGGLTGAQRYQLFLARRLAA